jgi:hypothetical protein
MAELLLDPAIRLWVILPIVLITLLFGLVRHYVTVLLKQDQTPQRDKIKDAQALIRSRSLRENGGCIPLNVSALSPYFHTVQIHLG